jgi:hypothetical protein
MFDPRRHNYFEKLMQLIEQGQAPRGCVLEVDVYHDDWCRIYHGGYCSCDPEVRIRPTPGLN